MLDSMEWFVLVQVGPFGKIDLSLSERMNNENSKRKENNNRFSKEK